MTVKYQITYEKSFRKQYKLLEKRRYDMALLDDVILMLAVHCSLRRKPHTWEVISC